MSSAMLLVVCGDARRRETFVSTLTSAGWPVVLSAASMSEAVVLLRNVSNACVLVDAELEDIKRVPEYRST